MAFSYLYVDPDGILNLNINLNDALVVHVFCVLVFIFSYFISSIGKRYISFRNVCSVKYLYFGYILSFLGLVVVVAQVTQSTSLFAYFSNLLSGADANSREAFMLSSEDGGLPGYLKIFANAPLAIYLYSFYLYACLKLDSNSLFRVKRLLVFSFVCVVFKTLFSLDRLSLLAIILTYSYLLGVRGVKARSIIFLSLIFVLANFLSGIRLTGYTLLDFLFLYMKLGLINLQLVIDGDYELTYGFQTFFHFVTYFDRNIFDFLGLEFQDYEWYWNPALYFTSYGFLDFGYAVIFIYFILGFFCSWLDRTIAYGNPGLIQSAYFVFLYAFASFFTVPAIRGVEFILALLICFFMTKITVRKGSIC